MRTTTTVRSKDIRGMFARRPARDVGIPLDRHSKQMTLSNFMIHSFTL